MTKKNKSNPPKKESFFAKIAILLAPIDEGILFSGRKLANKQTGTDKESDKASGRLRCSCRDIHPMQVIKI